MVVAGQVVFAGAGPGTDRWLTVAAADIVARADVIFVDALVAPSVLSDVRWDADVIDVGKRGGKPSVPQEKINALLVDYAQRGHRVLRLKGGDPCTFGRLAEEIQALADAGIGYEIIPGISAAAAAAARAGISLTDRDTSASLTLLTGHRRTEGIRPEMDWAAASRSGTGVVYMGSRNAEENVARLLDEGVDPDTPALIAQSLTTPREQLVTSALRQLPDVIAQAGLRPPVLWLYGEAMRSAREQTMPPHGYVALFRPQGTGEPWRTGFREAGWEPCLFPLQKIEPLSVPAFWSLIETAATGRMWLVFTSPNAVRNWAMAFTAHSDVRTLAGVQIAVVGSATAEALAHMGFKADLIGSGNAGAGDLVRQVPDGPGQVAWLCAADGDTEAAAQLVARGWSVTHVPTHRKKNRAGLPGALQFAVERQLLDAAVWTSVSQVRLAADWDLKAFWGRIPHVAIGQKTADALNSLPVTDLRVAETSDFTGVLAQLNA